MWHGIGLVPETITAPSGTCSICCPMAALAGSHASPTACSSEETLPVCVIVNLLITVFPRVVLLAVVLAWKGELRCRSHQWRGIGAVGPESRQLVVIPGGSPARLREQ